jgi:hypothetical protein
MGLFDKLRNGDTKLKSLRFGADNSFDQSGEGYSNQPYIIKPIPDGQISNTGIDYILNGGALAVNRTIDDVSRLTQMFFDTKTPSGLTFIAKQEALTRLGVKTQAGGQEIYLPTSTIAQAGVEATGLHFYKQGIDPIPIPFDAPIISLGPLGNLSLTGNIIKYSQVVRGNKSTDLDPNNRLVQLTNNKLLNLNPALLLLSNPNNISPLDNGILQYGGGPGSILGIGKTNINFADQRITLGKGDEYYNITTSTFSTLPLYLIQKAGDNINSDRGHASYIPKIQDFRTKLRSPGEKSSIISDSFSYDWGKNQTIENRVHLGDPGRRGDISSYVGGKKIDGEKVGATDKITSKTLYKSRYVDTENTNDLVKFRIEAINNDDPGESVFIHFRAFLDSFSDAYTANWNPTKYVGRGEEFYTYGGFTRGSNINWTVAAQSKDELIPMYQKLNYLASNLTPDYSGKGYMRGPMMRLTVGGYLYSQPGFITSLTYTVDENTPWEIGINNISTESDTNTLAGETKVSDNSVKELPHIIKVIMAYTPIHTFVPRKQDNVYKGPLAGQNTGKYLSAFGDERYIALSQGDHNNYTNAPNYIPTVTPSNQYNDLPVNNTSNIA